VQRETTGYDLHNSLQDISTDDAPQLSQKIIADNSCQGEEQLMTSEVGRASDSVRQDELWKDLRTVLSIDYARRTVCDIVSCWTVEPWCILA
jgi:hypothetical protein